MVDVSYSMGGMRSSFERSFRRIAMMSGFALAVCAGGAYAASVSYGNTDLFPAHPGMQARAR